jgi:predicted pyridoxine 5'-phosphate oxidase superfamily flavin-nucleotide-binding protein
MKRLSTDVVQFFQDQGFVVVSTIDRAGRPHNSCKGIVDINSSGLIYLLDLYQGRTYENLRKNPHISITAVDEHRFTGYCLKGKARMVIGDKLKPQIIKAWEGRITSRIASRLIRNVQGEKGHPRHPEALLPKPKYLIVMKTEEVVDLSPHSLKQES